MRIMNSLLVLATLLAPAAWLATPARADSDRDGRGRFESRDRGGRGDDGRGDWRGNDWQSDWRGGYGDRGRWGDRDESCGRSYFYHDVFNGWTNSHISAFKEFYLHRGGGPSWIQKVDIASGQVLANYAWDPRCQGWRKLCDAEVRDLAGLSMR